MNSAVKIAVPLCLLAALAAGIVYLLRPVDAPVVETQATKQAPPPAPEQKSEPVVAPKTEPQRLPDQGRT